MFRNQNLWVTGVLKGLKSNKSKGSFGSRSISINTGSGSDLLADEFNQVKGFGLVNFSGVVDGGKYSLSGSI